MDIKRRESVLRILAQRIKNTEILGHVDFDRLEEIRLRQGKPVIYYQEGKEYVTDCITDQNMLMEVMEYVTSYSRYAYENELRQGFITVEGGHRIGICGKAVYENGKIKNIQHISSINIRVSHEVPGCANILFPGILEKGKLLHTLIISPPGRGKTTLLRDLIRQISDGNSFIRGHTVGVVDERSEIGACYGGSTLNNLGIRTDILDSCAKTDGMMMLVRSMRPEILAVDEIGGEKDMEGIAHAMNAGVVITATIHGDSIDRIKKNAFFTKFRRYVIMSREGKAGEIEGIYDEWGNRL